MILTWQYTGKLKQFGYSLIVIKWHNTKEYILYSLISDLLSNTTNGRGSNIPNLQQITSAVRETTASRHNGGIYINIYPCEGKHLNNIMPRCSRCSKGGPSIWRPSWYERTIGTHDRYSFPVWPATPPLLMFTTCAKIGQWSRVYITSFICVYIVHYLASKYRLYLLSISFQNKHNMIVMKFFETRSLYYRNNVDTERMLTQKTMLTQKEYWHENNVNTERILTQKECWHRKNVDTKRMLTQKECWHKKNIDTKRILTQK